MSKVKGYDKAAYNWTGAGREDGTRSWSGVWSGVCKLTYSSVYVSLLDWSGARRKMNWMKFWNTSPAAALKWSKEFRGMIVLLEYICFYTKFRYHVWEGNLVTDRRY